MNKELNPNERKVILTFKKHDSIGGNDAIDDREFLFNCFVDLGDLEQLSDFNNPKCLLLGRTGAGKTALVTKLKEDRGDRVISLDPEALAMQYISNSTVVSYLIESGVDLNTFYKLLWRHQICVEIFNRHVKVTSEAEHDNFLEKVRYEFKKRNPSHLKALEYLEKWKNDFWKTSDSHVTAMVTTTEDSVSAGLGVTSDVLDAKIKGTSKFTAEEMTSVKQLGQSIVNDLQMKDVTGLLDMLDDFIELHQSRYYIVLDELDEKWVGNDIRYKLIKSLIETCKELNRLNNIKPIVVLRHDLLNRVFVATRDTGFQAEKYTPLYLDIRWSKEQLVDLVNLRLNHLLHVRYSKRRKLTYKDVLPAKIRGSDSIEYIIDRSLMRPRDVIEFMNLCINQVSLENGTITEEAVIDAEVVYSQSRISALYYEWFTEYPGLRIWIAILKRRASKFSTSTLDEDMLLQMCFDYLDNPPETEYESTDLILELTKRVKDSRLSIEEFRKEILYIFYQINLIGLKNSEDRGVSWFQHNGIAFTVDDIDENTEILVHACYKTALKIKNE